MLLECPVCRSSSTNIRHIYGDLMIASIASLMPDLSVPSFDVKNYQLVRCNCCAFEFSDPFLPGDDAFYNWICQSKYYYPIERWEWDPVISFAGQNNLVSVLDVGCGSGLFLEKLASNSIQGTGIDLNPDSVTVCQDKGLNARCIPLTGLANADLTEFSLITLFHVLEHIADPIQSVLELKNCLSDEGFIAISVPLSPMSFESDWQDPLNLPPHHIGRWNKKSLTKLASEVSMTPRFFIQPSLGLFQRTVITLRFVLSLDVIAGQGKWIRRFRHIKRIVSNPLISLKILMNQIKRDSLAGEQLGDTILMILSSADK